MCTVRWSLLTAELVSATRSWVLLARGGTDSSCGKHQKWWTPLQTTRPLFKVCLSDLSYSLRKSCLKRVSWQPSPMCSLLEISLQPFEKFETKKKKKKDRLPLWKEFICVRQIIRKGFITLKWLVSIFPNAWVKKLKVLNFIYFRLLPPSASRWQCLHSMIKCLPFLFI